MDNAVRVPALRHRPAPHGQHSPSERRQGPSSALPDVRGRGRHLQQAGPFQDRAGVFRRVAVHQSLSAGQSRSGPGCHGRAIDAAFAPRCENAAAPEAAKSLSATGSRSRASAGYSRAGRADRQLDGAAEAHTFIIDSGYVEEVGNWGCLQRVRGWSFRDLPSRRRATECVHRTRGRLQTTAIRPPDIRASVHAVRSS